MIELQLPIDELETAASEAAEAAVMDERSFQLLYERTARPIWAYLSRVTRNSSVADDLLQEVYHRFLRAKPPEKEKNYLYRIATNLLRDRLRGARNEVPLPEDIPRESAGRAVEARTDLHRAMERMSEKERPLLWLAYAEGFSHREIAAATGIKVQSVRPMLHRAKNRLARLLRRRGFRQ